MRFLPPDRSFMSHSYVTKIHYTLFLGSVLLLWCNVVGADVLSPDATDTADGQSSAEWRQNQNHARLSIRFSCHGGELCALNNSPAALINNRIILRIVIEGIFLVNFELLRGWCEAGWLCPAAEAFSALLLRGKVDLNASTLHSMIPKWVHLLCLPMSMIILISWSLSTAKSHLCVIFNVALGELVGTDYGECQCYFHFHTRIWIAAYIF